MSSPSNSKLSSLSSFSSPLSASSSASSSEIMSVGLRAVAVSMAYIYGSATVRLCAVSATAVYSSMAQLLIFLSMDSNRCPVTLLSLPFQFQLLMQCMLPIPAMHISTASLVRVVRIHLKRWMVRDVVLFFS